MQQIIRDIVGDPHLQAWHDLHNAIEDILNDPFFINATPPRLPSILSGPPVLIPNLEEEELRSDTQDLIDPHITLRTKQVKLNRYKHAFYSVSLHPKVRHLTTFKFQGQRYAQIAHGPTFFAALPVTHTSRNAAQPVQKHATLA